MDFEKVAPKESGYYYYVDAINKDTVSIVYVYKAKGKINQYSTRPGDKKSYDCVDLERAGSYWSKEKIHIPSLSEIDIY